MERYRIEGAASFIASKSVLTNFIEKDSNQKGVCLITGNNTDVVRKVTPTPILNCKSSASLVSFQTDQGYDSYYKSQAYNAPISFEAEFAFSTAVKRLIEENSHNKFKIGNRLYLFWASSASQAAKESEDSLFALLGRPETDDDDPNRRI